MICIFYNYVSGNLLDVPLLFSSLKYLKLHIKWKIIGRGVSIVIRTDVRIYKKYSNLIWKQEKDLKSIEENTSSNKID
jgi:hypothetical protein